MGQWLHTQVDNAVALSGFGANSSQTVTRDLPRSNFLGSIGFRIRLAGSTGAMTAGSTQMNRVRIIANGSAVLLDIRGGELRGVNKYETGVSSLMGGTSATTGATGVYYYYFGRFRRDEDVILPAKVFKSLQLQLTYTVGTWATTQPTAGSLDIWAEEYVSNDAPRSKRIKKVATVAQVAAGNSTVIRQKLPLGNFLRAIYIHTDDYRNIGGTSATDPTGTNLVRLLVNNGVETPVSKTPQALVDEAVVTYRFDDANVPGAESTGIVTDAWDGASSDANRLLKLDFDVAENLGKVLDTSRMNELTVEVTGATSGTTGNVTFLTEEIITVG